MSEKHDFYKAAIKPIELFLKKDYNLHIEGEENILDIPTLFTPNHIQFLDSVFVAIAYTKVTGKPLRFGAKQEYFDGKGIDDNGKWGRTLQWAMEHSRQIPVDRETKSRQAFLNLQDAVKDRTDHGDSVALHPEGTRSTDGRIHKYKSGAARIAIAHSLPTGPTGLIYDRPSNSRKTDVRVIFGEPIMPEAYNHPPYSLLANGPKAELLAQITENRVADLTGMEQSGIFAILRKNRHQHGSHDQA